jgi:hypothetical protein
MSKRNTIWVQSAFNQNQVPKIKDAVDRIGASVYDVVIMASLHVDSKGQFYFGDTPFDRMWDGFSPALLDMKTSFQTTKKLLITIGGWGNEADFDHIAADVPGFTNKFVRLAEIYHLDGLDLDFEGPYTPKYRDILVSIINSYHATGTNPIITMSPYTDAGFWAGQDGVLSGTRTRAGNAVRWLNVQFYSGSSNTPPFEWPACFKSWKDAVANGPNGIPEGQAAGFIDPGCNTETYTLKDIREAITATVEAYPEMGGAFAWNYDQIGGLNLGEWARTMYGALNGAEVPARSQAG